MRTIMKRGHVLNTPFEVGYDGAHFLLVHDEAAGRPSYTVYRIPASPSRRVRIVGRELPFPAAMKLALRLAKAIDDN